MPSNWLYIDTQFPSFTGEEDLNEKVTTIQNYMFMLVEQLRYTLHNLDLTNMNGKALSDFVGDITDPIYAKIEDSDGNVAQLQLDVEGLRTQVQDAEGNIAQLELTSQGLASQLQDAEGNISALQQTSTSLSSRLQSAEGSISSLQQTAAGLSSTVASQGGQISSLQQTVNGFSLSVWNGSDSSTISLMSNGVVLSSQSIVMSGVVTFTDLSTPGATTIYGGNIETGTVTAANLRSTYVELLDDYGMTAGSIGLQGASSYYGQKVTINSGALELAASYGDVFISSGSGSFITLTSGLVSVSGNLAPSYSGSYSLGTGSRLWTDVYAENSAIQTSDAKAKNSIEALPDKYIAMMEAVRPVRYKLNEGTSGRYHVGFIAQEVEAAMEAAGVSSLEFGGFVRDKDEAGEDIYLLRYGEFTAILWAKIMELDAKVKELTA